MKRKQEKQAFKLRVGVYLVSMVLPGAAMAGDGWGDFTPYGSFENVKVPTYYANSPTGYHNSPVGSCFDAAGTPIAPGGNGAVAANPVGNCFTGAALRKFVDQLPGVAMPGGAANSPTINGDKKYIPLAIATKWVNLNGDTTNDDYYEIAVVEYQERFHSDLKNPTSIRGYVQIDPNATAEGVTTSANSKAVQLFYPDGTAIQHNGKNVYAYDKPHYLGPIIIANQHVPTRLKFFNLLPVGRAVKDANGNVTGPRNGDLFLPVDESLAGAGFGPDGTTKYTQNRAEVHLHGGDNPWISDGTPHQWITPAGEKTAANGVFTEALAKIEPKVLAEMTAANDRLAPARQLAAEVVAANAHAEAVKQASQYLIGVSAVGVPDMPPPGPGEMTYYFPNGESARLMFYHDHTFGLTRLNVYAGEAAGYVLTDAKEAELVATGAIPADMIPLVIQDKTFVPEDIAIQDARWDTNAWGGASNFWFPHVYETNQHPGSSDGTNGVGRWDWGPWFWPVFPSAMDRLPDGSYKKSDQVIPGTIGEVTGLSEVSTTPEAFMDTPIVNGVAYPTLTVDPKSYRFRILNAGNDRFMNLGLYVAADKNTTNPADPRLPDSQPKMCDGKSGVPVADCTEVKMVYFDRTYPTLYYPNKTLPDGTPAPTGFPTTGGLLDTGWGNPTGHLAMDSGVPDPAYVGPDIHVYGNETGLLPNIVTIPSTPTNYEANRRSVTVMNVLEHGLYLSTAGRADVVIDFSKYAGQTLLLVNDAPAPVPALDPRIDYYTGMGDFSGVGGSESPMPGYGPNTRTIMQIHVNAGTPAAPFDPAVATGEIAKAYGATQPKPIVPETAYNDAFPGIAAADTWARIYMGSIYLGQFQGLSFTTPESLTYTEVPRLADGSVCTNPTNCASSLKAPVTVAAGTNVTAYIHNKAIQELFEPAYGRMNATLGIELPFTSALTQTTLPLGYIDPTTETVADGETQFWKVTHNGVDTHPVHFHLVNVQIVNRIGWDGTIKQPTADEFGWKETVIMNPLEDIVVAVRAKTPAVPFGLPNSVRAKDPSQPLGVRTGFTQVNPNTGNPQLVTNTVEDYAWEYVWHCHILGHEENDFMRPFVFDFWNSTDTVNGVAEKRNAKVNNVAVNVPGQIAGLEVNAGVLRWADPTPYDLPSTLRNPKNEIYFAITRKGANDPAPVVYQIPANQTVFTDPAPNGAVATDYSIVAHNQMGDSVRTTGAVPSAPLAPTWVGVTGVSSTGMTIQWKDNAFNETGYKVQYGVVGSPDPLTEVLLPANANSYVLTNLSADTNYQFNVIATNGQGDSAAATGSAATTPTASVLSAVVDNINLTATLSGWTAGATVELTVTGPTGVLPVTVNADGTASVTGLNPDTAYTASLVVTGASGVKAPAVTGNFATNAAVNNVAATMNANNSVSLSWSQLSVAAPAKVLVYTATSAGATNWGNPITTAAIAYSAGSAVISNLTAGRWYKFAVEVTGANGVVVSSGMTPTAVQAAGLTSGGILVSAPSATSFRATWTRLTPAQDPTATNADLRVNVINGAGTVVRTYGPLQYDVNSQTVSGLSPNTAYTVEVRGLDADTTLFASGTGITNAQPATLVKAVAGGIQTTSVDLTWTMPASGGTPVVTVKKAGVVVPATVDFKGSTTSATVGGLAANTAYTFEVRVIGLNGNPTAAAVSAPVVTGVEAAGTPSVASTTTTSAVVNWTMPASGGTSTVVVSQGGTVFPARVVKLSATSASITGLSQNSLYDVVVQTTSGTTSATSLATQVKTNAVDVTVLRVTPYADTSATLNWYNPIGGGTAEITVNGPGFNNVKITDAAINAGGLVKHVVGGLTPNAAYTFTVKYTGITGVQTAGVSVSAHTLATLSAATEVGLPIAMRAANSIVMSWTDNSVGETGYTVQVHSATAANGVRTGAWSAWANAAAVVAPHANPTGDTVSATVTANMAANRMYEFRVIPVSTNTAQTGPASAVSPVIDQSLAAVPVTSATMTAAANQVNLTWIGAGNANEFIQVQRRTVGGAWANIGTAAGNSGGFSNVNLVSGNQYQYRVQAINRKTLVNANNWVMAVDGNGNDVVTVQ